MEDYKLKYLKYKKKYLSLKSQIGGGRITEDEAKQLVKDSFRTPQKYEDVIRDIMHYGYSRESAQIIFMKAREELQKEIVDDVLKQSVNTARYEETLRSQGEAKKSLAETRRPVNVKDLIKDALNTSQKRKDIYKDIMAFLNISETEAEIKFIEVRQELQREAEEAAIANSLVTAKEEADIRSQGEAKKSLAEIQAAEIQAEEDFRSALALSEAEAARSKLEEEALENEQLRRVLELSETDK